MSNISEQNFDRLTMNYIYSYYVKYDRLKILIDQTYANSGATSINVFIDIMDIIRNLDKRIRHPLNYPLVITSGIINMVAHYRQFFRSRYGCTSKFWLIASEDSIIANRCCEDFKYPHISNQMKSMYVSNLVWLPSLCQYIPDVQYLRTQVDFTTKMMSVISVEQNLGNTNPVLAITKDPFEFIGTRAGVQILRPRKTRNGDDESYIVGANHAITRYVLEVQGNDKLIDLANSADYHLCNFPLLMALSKVPSRSLSSYLPMKSALLNVLQLTKIGGALSIDNWAYYLNGKIPNFNEDIIKKRYHACWVVSHYEQYSVMPEASQYQGIVNLYDPEGVKAINNEHFASCPLDLNVL